MTPEQVNESRLQLQDSSVQSGSAKLAANQEVVSQLLRCVRQFQQLPRDGNTEQLQLEMADKLLQMAAQVHPHRAPTLLRDQTHHCP